MLTSQVITLKSTKDFKVPTSLGFALNALFLELVKKIDYKFSEKIHNISENKPYTVSNLLGGKLYINEGLINISNAETYNWKITGLNDEVSVFLQEKFIPSLPETLKVAGAELKVIDINNNAMAKTTTYADLYQAHFTTDTNDNSLIELEFLTPTAFKINGLTVPLPIPKAIFTGYINKWNNFCDINLGENETLDQIETYLALKSHFIKTSYGFIKNNAKFTGFVGKVNLKLRKNCPEHILKIVNMLSEYSLFCGTGARTSLSYGQTIRINSLLLNKKED